MGENLEYFLARGGYENEIFVGYFNVKLFGNSGKKGIKKPQIPYAINHIHPASNPKISLMRVTLLDYENGQFYKLKSWEDFQSYHLKDSVFEPAEKEEKPLPINALGMLVNVTQIEIAFDLGNHAREIYRTTIHRRR